MQIRDIAVLLARDAGISTLSPAQDAANVNVRGMPEGLLTALANSLNTAYVELWKLSPSALFERRGSTVLYPPTTITITATQYSTAVVITANGAAWMPGCTTLVAGDAFDNEFIDATTLLRPYMGATGSKAATVWCDAVKLPANVSVVLDSVNIRGIGPLKASSWDEMQRLGGLPHQQGGGVNNSNKSTGQPCAYLVESQYNQSVATPTRANFLRLSPMPVIAAPMDYRLLGTPPIITEADIDSGDHEFEPQSDVFIPWPELTLYAVARQHFSGDPLFVNEAGRPEIMRQRNLAIDSLQNTRAQGESAPACYANGVFRG